MIFLHRLEPYSQRPVTVSGNGERGYLIAQKAKIDFKFKLYETNFNSHPLFSLLYQY